MASEAPRFLSEASYPQHSLQPIFGNHINRLQPYPLRYPYLVHVHAPLFVTIRLNAFNFLIWESQILNLIKSQVCMGFIDGSIVQPSLTTVVQTANSIN